MNSRLTFGALLCALGACTSPQESAPGSFQAKVVGLSDGDTLTVLRDRSRLKVRLAEIDCPEKSQPFGSVARDFAAEQVFGKVVGVRVVEVDRYGRSVAVITTPDGRSLSEALVKAGLAWKYDKHSSSARLEALETDARKARRGLWAEPSPVPPWEFRRKKRGRGN